MANLLCCLNIHMFKVIITYNYTKGKEKGKDILAIVLVRLYPLAHCPVQIYPQYTGMSKNLVKIRKSMRECTTRTPSKMYKINKQK